MNGQSRYSSYILLAGDLLILLGMTVWGQASHGTLDSGVVHFLINFVSFAVAWFLAGPLLLVYDDTLVRRPAELWRPVWGAVLAAPLGGLIRALLLGSAVVPVFVLVMGGFMAAAFTIWRGLYLLVRRSAGPKRAANG